MADGATVGVAVASSSSGAASINSSAVIGDAITSTMVRTRVLSETVTANAVASPHQAHDEVMADASNVGDVIAVSVTVAAKRKVVMIS
jgi:hypothetical protein